MPKSKRDKAHPSTVLLPKCPSCGEHALIVRPTDPKFDFCLNCEWKAEGYKSGT